MFIAPRGPRSDAVLRALSTPARPAPLPPPDDDPLTGDDTPLALHLLYEVHYRGLPGVDDRREWDPALLAMRARLEAEFELALIRRVGPVPRAMAVADVLSQLDALAAGDGPSLSQWMLDNGDVHHLREFAIHRSIYQRKEADPHTFAIPRLQGSAKAALVAIQRGEYGDGRAADMHSELFAETLRLLDLDDAYGAYLDVVPGVTLTTSNLVSLFGLHRHWRGALAGHLALFEMCSVEPMRRYADTVRRLGLPDRAAHFYDVHVTADAAHQYLGRDMLAAGLAVDEPELAGQIVFGARALAATEAAFARHLLECWQRGETSLRAGATAPAGAPAR